MMNQPRFDTYDKRQSNYCYSGRWQTETTIGDACCPRPIGPKCTTRTNYNVCARSQPNPSKTWCDALVKPTRRFPPPPIPRWSFREAHWGDSTMLRRAQNPADTSQPKHTQHIFAFGGRYCIEFLASQE